MITIAKNINNLTQKISQTSWKLIEKSPNNKKFIEKLYEEYIDNLDKSNILLNKSDLDKLKNGDIKKIVFKSVKSEWKNYVFILRYSKSAKTYGYILTCKNINPPGYGINLEALEIDFPVLGKLINTSDGSYADKSKMKKFEQDVIDNLPLLINKQNIIPYNWLQYKHWNKIGEADPMDVGISYDDADEAYWWSVSLDDLIEFDKIDKKYDLEPNPIFDSNSPSIQYATHNMKNYHAESATYAINTYVKKYWSNTYTKKNFNNIDIFDDEFIENNDVLLKKYESKLILLSSDGTILIKLLEVDSKNNETLFEKKFVSILDKLNNDIQEKKKKIINKTKNLKYSDYWFDKILYLLKNKRKLLINYFVKKETKNLLKFLNGSASVKSIFSVNQINVMSNWHFPRKKLFLENSNLVSVIGSYCNYSKDITATHLNKLYKLEKEIEEVSKQQEPENPKKPKPKTKKITKIKPNPKKKCSKRNPEPPCLDEFEERLNKKRDLCCYKKKKTKKNNKSKLILLPRVNVKNKKIISETYNLDTNIWKIEYNKDTDQLTTYWGKKDGNLRSNTKKGSYNDVQKLIKSKTKKGYKLF